jgi:hypothetical protein
MTMSEDLALRFVVYMSVDRRGDDRTVPEECLNKSEVNALLEEQGGNHMPKYMGREFRRSAGCQLQNQTEQFSVKSVE